MKNIIGWALLCLLIACGADKNARQLVVTGKALPGEQVALLHNRSGMMKTVVADTVDGNGNFRLVYEPERAGIYSLSAGKSRMFVMLMVRPGEEMEADLSGEKAVFGKDGAERNRYMQELWEQQKRWRKVYPAGLADAAAYRQSMDKQYEAVKAYLQQRPLPDPELAGLLATYIQVQHYQALLNYPFLCQMVTGNPVELPDEYYSFLEEADISSPWLANLGNAHSFLQEYFSAMENRGYLETGKDYLVRRAARLPDGKVREDYLLGQIEQVELNGYNQHLGKQLEQLSAFMVTPDGKAKLEELGRKYAVAAETNKRLNAGQPAFDFAGTDENGKEHRLSDYKGRVVVVDVWNTGCKPCIAEIPYLERLEKQFENKGVVFISYSLDTDTEVWKRFLKSHGMTGRQWVNTGAFKSDFARDYRVRFIPRFMVFDKEGRIVEVYAPRPSDPRLAQLIGELL